jgi:hypothetical protein
MKAVNNALLAVNVLAVGEGLRPSSRAEFRRGRRSRSQRLERALVRQRIPRAPAGADAAVAAHLRVACSTRTPALPRTCWTRPACPAPSHWPRRKCTSPAGSGRCGRLSGTDPAHRAGGRGGAARVITDPEGEVTSTNPWGSIRRAEAEVLLAGGVVVRGGAHAGPVAAPRGPRIGRGIPQSRPALFRAHQADGGVLFVAKAQAAVVRVRPKAIRWIPPGPRWPSSCGWR